MTSTRKRAAKQKSASQLGRLRERIDRVDEKLVGLLEERAALVEAVGKDKQKTGRVVFDPGREKEVRARLSRLAKGRFPTPALEVIFREIVSASRALEAPTRVGFLGRTGSLAHWAAVRRFGSSSSFAAFGSGEALLSALESGEREYALVSLEGLPEDPGFDAFDVLLSSRARVYGEFHQEGGRRAARRWRESRVQAPKEAPPIRALGTIGPLLALARDAGLARLGAGDVELTRGPPTRLCRPAVGASARRRWPGRE